MRAALLLALAAGLAAPVPAAAGPGAGTRPSPDAAKAAPADPGGTARAPGDTLAILMARGYLAAARDEAGTVRAGPLYRLGRIAVTGPSGFTAEQLGLAPFAGEAASAANVEALGTRARAWLLDHGRPFAALSVDFSVRTDAPIADLGLAVDAGEGYQHGGLKGSGSRTRPETLERMSLLRFGDPFSRTRLDQALARLARAGYYDDIVPGRLYRDPARNLLYPSVRLTDRKGNRLSGLLGYDSEKQGGDGLDGFLDIHLINLRGTARDLDFTFDSKRTPGGPGSKEAKLAYVEPWILSTRVGARVDLAAAIEDSAYEEARGELTLFQDLDFRSRLLVSLARQFNRDFAADSRSEAQIAGLGFQYDGRDQVPSTLRGARFALRANAVRRDLGDSSYFLVQTSDEFGIWADAGRWVFHAAFAAGGDWPLAERPDRGDLFALGGANTLRGYREREFLTDLYGYADLEIQFLLAPGSRASLFAVPGLVNQIGRGDISWKRVLGYGAGLESGTRDWTFGISYALNPDRAPGDGFVHLGVANNF